MFTNIRIRIGGVMLMAKNHRGDVVLGHSVALTLAREDKEVNLAMAPTFLHALLSKVDKDNFSKLSKPLQLNAIRAWIKTCDESVKYKSLEEMNREEPNIVY